MVSSWVLHASDVPKVVHHKPVTEVETTKRVATVRRLQFRQEDLNEHGYTQNCPKCQHIITKSQSKLATMNRSAQCRVQRV